MTAQIYAGIDVSFAKDKRLPVCVLRREQGRLEPLPLKRLAKPPRGEGNRAVLDPARRRTFAREVVDWLDAIEVEIGCTIPTVGIDAPSACCASDRGRRAAEEALDRAKISCIATPTQEQFEVKCEAARRHLDAGGPLNRLPSANQLWMLVGFELFAEIGRRRTCREVFPHATVRALGIEGRHKTTKAGYRAQRRGAAEATGHEPEELEAKLAVAGFGSRHDRLDAFLSAWIAAMPESELRAYGEPPGDVIWVPATPAC